ncbi:hypothetical protein NPIL_411251 [Nephila pilipes]|uniref:Uncharacterized protein n=1 Tax=Nephila pilipes TaxID=299642 RepID=A0A8X6IL23_NEPPI|nr:hypothetical protein NPIL_411251 [Nephila pilipes]
MRSLESASCSIFEFPETEKVWPFHRIYSLFFLHISLFCVSFKAALQVSFLGPFPLERSLGRGRGGKLLLCGFQQNFLALFQVEEEGRLSPNIILIVR